MESSLSNRSEPESGPLVSIGIPDFQSGPLVEGLRIVRTRAILPAIRDYCVGQCIDRRNH